MVFPFVIGFAPARPSEPLPMIAFERPMHTHAMCVPAPPPILKLSRESDIRRPCMPVAYAIAQPAAV
jgi:hypothetical protein